MKKFLEVLEYQSAPVKPRLHLGDQGAPRKQGSGRFKTIKTSGPRSSWVAVLLTQ